MIENYEKISTLAVICGNKGMTKKIFWIGGGNQKIFFGFFKYTKMTHDAFSAQFRLKIS